MYELCNKVTLEEISSLNNLLALIPQKSGNWILICIQFHQADGMVKCHNESEVSQMLKCDISKVA